MATHESFKPTDVMPSWTETIDGVDVVVHQGLNFFLLLFPDGTQSFHDDNGRIVTLHADGGMDVVDPEEEYTAHHSATELAVDAAELEAKIRGIIDKNKE